MCRSIGTLMARSRKSQWSVLPIWYEIWLEDATAPAFITMNKTIVMKSYGHPHEEGNIVLYVTIGSTTVNQRLDAFIFVQHQPRQSRVSSQMPPLSSNSANMDVFASRANFFWWQATKSSVLLERCISTPRRHSSKLSSHSRSLHPW